MKSNDTLLTCAVCGRNDLLRLTRHLSQVHGISATDYIKEHPGAVLEVLPSRIPKCISCGIPVDGCNPRSANVKCGTCRKDRPFRTIEAEGLVSCCICGLWFRRLGIHLKTAHDLTRGQYLADYPGTLLEIPGTRNHTDTTRQKISLALRKYQESIPKQISEQHPVEPYIPKCTACGVEVFGYAPAARNVKCDGCRKTTSLVKRGDTPSNQVPCRVCGVSRRMLTPHLVTAHGLTKDQYLAMYPEALTDAPGARTRSDVCKQKMTEKAKIRWASEDERQKQSIRSVKNADAWRGKPLTEDHRKAISNSMKGKHHNMTPEGSATIGAHGRTVLAEFRASPEAHNKLSQGAKRRIARGGIFGFMDPDIWQRGFETRLHNGTLNPPGVGRGICGFRLGIPHYCRSTFEANFARVLIHLGVPYNYEPKLFKLSNGTYYTPDFYLLGPFLDGLIPAGWVELKGWRQKDGQVPTQPKIDLFTQETGQMVTVLAMKDALWKTIEDRYSNLVQNWETPRRNLRTHRNIFGLVALPLPEVLSLVQDP